MGYFMSFEAVTCVIKQNLIFTVCAWKPVLASTVRFTCFVQLAVAYGQYSPTVLQAEKPANVSN